MGSRSKIEWTDSTWNPVSGCTQISEGCRFCYAKRTATRFAGSDFYPDGFKVTLHPDQLDKPIRWRKPRKVFVVSQGDLFHEDVPTDFIRRVLEVIGQADQHLFMILTKRPRRMREILTSTPVSSCSSWPIPHLWCGVTVENQKEDWRIEELIRTPATRRFISYEPALGPLNIGLAGTCPKDWNLGYTAIYDHIHWVIAGCESGRESRNAPDDWFRNVRDECVSTGVPFFLKQMKYGRRLEKMPQLDGKVWNQTPEDDRC